MLTIFSKVSNPEPMIGWQGVGPEWVRSYGTVSAEAMSSPRLIQIDNLVKEYDTGAGPLPRAA